MKFEGNEDFYNGEDFKNPSEDMDNLGNNPKFIPTGDLIADDINETPDSLLMKKEEVSELEDNFVLIQKKNADFMEDRSGTVDIQKGEEVEVSTNNSFSNEEIDAVSVGGSGNRNNIIRFGEMTGEEKQEEFYDKKDTVNNSKPKRQHDNRESIRYKKAE